MNDFLQSLKELRKEKKEYLDKFYERKVAIVDFLRSVNLYGSINDYQKEWENISKKIFGKQAELNSIKDQSKVKDDRTRALEAKMFLIRKEIRQNEEAKEELSRYLGKLNVLRNQYQTETVKLDYLILANGKFQKIDFVRCPVCLGKIHKSELEKCYLCGNDVTELSKEEELAIKLERKRVQSRLTKLVEFMEEKEQEIKNIGLNIKNKSNELSGINEKIDEIQQIYISPYIERIEVLNRGIGELKENLRTIDENVKVKNELEQISDEITSEELKLQELIDEIKRIENDSEDVGELFNQFSKAFENTLKAFEFPKLNNAYIDNKTYIPYVRNTRYNDLGSLGAVTLITVAYFLSILKISIQLKKTYHTGLRMLDSISSNMGREANDTEDEFKDDKIFRAMVKHISEFAETNKNKLQLVIVNNGYTDDVKNEQLIEEFDGDGSKNLPYGLIDDMTK